MNSIFKLNSSKNLIQCSIFSDTLKQLNNSKNSLFYYKDIKQRNFITLVMLFYFLYFNVMKVLNIIF